MKDVDDKEKAKKPDQPKVEEEMKEVDQEMEEEQVTE